MRIDRVTNARPGVELYKTDWAGEPLAGATFTLKDGDGVDVGAAQYVSDETGRITIAYLSPGAYTLAETAVPSGFAAMAGGMTITVDDDENVTVSGADEEYYTLSTEGIGEGMTARITIRNRKASLQVRKMDAVTGDPIPGVHFELYPQVVDVDGTPRKDYMPMAGYEDLITDGEGVLGEITLALVPGTYYLHETQPAEGYDALESDVCFTLGADGAVTLADEAQAALALLLLLRRRRTE